MFVFEDALSAVNKMIDKSSVSDDIKFSIQNNVVNGKVGSNNMFASKLYDNNYFLVGLGNKNELTIQKYEKCVSRISASRLFEFTRILEVDISYFFEGYQTSVSYLRMGGSAPIPNFLILSAAMKV